MPGIRRKPKKAKLTKYEEFQNTLKIMETFDLTKEPTEGEAIALIAAFEMGCKVRAELFSAAQSFPHDTAVAYFLLNSSQDLNRYLNNFFEKFNKDKKVEEPAKSDFSI